MIIFCDFAQCVKEVFVFGKIDLGFYWWEFIQPKAKLVVRFIFHMERKKLGGRTKRIFGLLGYTWSVIISFFCKGLKC